MKTESDLEILLRNIQPVLEDGEFVFCSSSPEARRELQIETRAEFREAEGISLILRRELAESHGLAFTFVCRQITLNVFSDLQAVGFLAAITAKLAQANISVNAVSGYHHDYLFIPSEKSELAMDLLRELENGRRR